MIGFANRLRFDRLSGELDGSIDSWTGDALASVANEFRASNATSWKGLWLVIAVMVLPFLFVAWLLR